MIPRRSILSSTGSALLVAGGGCLTSPRADDDGRSNGTDDDAVDEGSSSETDDDGPSSETDDEADSDCDPESELDSGQRGEADTTVHESATPEDEADVEYVGDGTIRIVTGRSGDDVTSTETMPFDEWAEVWYPRVAADAVSDHLEEQLTDTDGIATDDNECLIVARHMTEYDEDGAVYAEPSVDVDRLVEATPRTASATVSAGDHEYTGDLPVYVEEVTFRTGNED